MTDILEHGDAERRHLRTIIVGVLALIAAGEAVDLALDRPRDWLSPHVIFELSLLLGALIALSVLGIGWLRASRSLDQARQELAERADERDAWRASAQAALDGLGRAIDEQFSAWGLSLAERDVALRLLKGHSHKQIAADTARSERTVRQHGGAVYAKSGLGGRAELAAFFLGDLMLPADARSAVRGATRDVADVSPPEPGALRR